MLLCNYQHRDIQSEDSLPGISQQKIAEKEDCEGWLTEEGEICKAFCDDTKDDEFMFQIIHLVEQLAGDEYLECIAMCSPDMVDVKNKDTERFGEKIDLMFEKLQQIEFN